jgi:hypothetical protein
MAFARRSYRIEFEYTCDQLQTLNTDDTVIISFNGLPKQATVDQVEVDESKRKMTITGKV